MNETGQLISVAYLLTHFYVLICPLVVRVCHFPEKISSVTLTHEVPVLASHRNQTIDLLTLALNGLIIRE